MGDKNVARHPELGYHPSAYQMRKGEEAEPKVIKGSSMKKRKNHTMEKSSKSPTFTEAGQR